MIQAAVGMLLGRGSEILADGWNAPGQWLACAWALFGMRLAVVGMLLGEGGLMRT